MQLLSTAALLALVSSAAAQCTTAREHDNCKSWIPNGFCTNTGYTMDMRKLYCGVSCGLCNANGTPTALGGGAATCTADANANCANWKNNGFCTNPAYTEAYKNQYCCKTCAAPAAPVAPTTACAVLYTGASTEVKNTGATTAIEPVTTNPLSKVYVKTGCTLTLWADPFTVATGSPISGTNAFVTVSGTAPAAMGYECTCP